MKGPFDLHDKDAVLLVCLNMLDITLSHLIVLKSSLTHRHVGTWIHTSVDVLHPVMKVPSSFHFYAFSRPAFMTLKSVRISQGWLQWIRFRFICCFMSRSTARVILRWVVYGWRNQCILVGQDSAL